MHSQMLYLDLALRCDGQDDLAARSAATIEEIMVKEWMRKGCVMIQGGVMVSPLSSWRGNFGGRTK